MNLKQEILKEHSKAQCTKIVNWIGSSQQRFDELFALFLNEEYRVTQRAGWPMSYCVIANPLFIKKHWKKLINNLKKPDLHDAVKRNSVRFLQKMEIPEKYRGDLMDICFKYLESPKEALAIKVFSMSVLGNLAKQYPEIKPELKLLIEEQLPNQSAGFKARAKKILKQLDKL
ncbi:MAG: hypothetical protein WBP16_15740 [Ferruginibacter sp.]